MHGHHVAPMSANQLSFYSAVAAEKAAAAQRAAEVRRKLLGQPIMLEDDEYRVSDRGEDTPERHPRRDRAQGEAAEDDAGGEPISMWA